MQSGCPLCTTSGISTPFGMLSPSGGQVAYALLTRLPLSIDSKLSSSVRLACVKHAASVRPEPGSNSPINFIEEPEWLLIIHVMEFQFVAQTCMLLITFVIPNHLANHLTNCCMILHCLVFREHLAPDLIAFAPSVSFYIITQSGFLVKTFFNLFLISF